MNVTKEIKKLFNYDKLREISNKELELKTKQNCALYAEQYLDTMEKIATLRVQKVFDDDSMEYSDNNFRYAMDLWWWYNRNVHGLSDKIQDEIFEVFKEQSLKDANFLTTEDE